MEMEKEIEKRQERLDKAYTIAKVVVDGAAKGDLGDNPSTHAVEVARPLGYCCP